MTTTVVNPIEAFKKDPNAKLDYTFDWSAWMVSGDTITASTFSIETISGDAAPLIVSTPAATFSASDSTATAWFTGGTAGNTYVVTNQITTSDGRIAENSIVIIVEDK